MDWTKVRDSRGDTPTRNEDIMTRRCCAHLIGLVLAATTAWADSTTNHANFGDTPLNPCQKITLSVAQTITPGGTTTTLYYKLQDCAGTVAEGNAAIPASAYQVRNKSTHTLRIATPPGSSGLQGTIDVTWSATTANQTTFSGTWKERQGNSTTQTREDQFFSTATVTGTVIGWNAGGYPGSVGSQSQMEK